MKRREQYIRLHSSIKRALLCCLRVPWPGRCRNWTGPGLRESKRRTNRRQRLGRRWHVTVCNARARQGPTPATIDRSLAASAATHAPFAVHLTTPLVIRPSIHPSIGRSRAAAPPRAESARTTASPAQPAGPPSRLSVSRLHAYTADGAAR